ncbi:hypothetical protein C8R43DRAFT_1136624 [Mycena crocata]|nr:hypothetical protein C8R43DRAFT_1136624 [Mycena crocata]
MPNAPLKSMDSSQVKGTLRAFFPVVVKVPEAGRRRPLDTPAPPPRQKPLTAAKAITPLAGTTNAGLLRSIRPRTTAIVHRSRAPRQVAAVPGERGTRDTPLCVEDLWLGTRAGPPEVAGADKDDKCTICLQLISHPVFSTCGHGHCYSCIRVWLEEHWNCPDCRAVITRAPFKVYIVEHYLLKTYGDWDSSVVDYDWTGLSFPVLACTGVYSDVFSAMAFGQVAEVTTVHNRCGFFVRLCCPANLTCAGQYAYFRQLETLQSIISDDELSSGLIPGRDWFKCEGSTETDSPERGSFYVHVVQASIQRQDSILAVLEGPKAFRVLVALPFATRIMLPVPATEAEISERYYALRSVPQGFPGFAYALLYATDCSKRRVVAVPWKTGVSQVLSPNDLVLDAWLPRDTDTVRVHHFPGSNVPLEFQYTIVFVPRDFQDEDRVNTCKSLRSTKAWHDNVLVIKHGKRKAIIGMEREDSSLVDMIVSEFIQRRLLP